MSFIILIILVSFIGSALSQKRVMPKNVTTLLFGLIVVLAVSALVTYDEPPIIMTQKSVREKETDPVNEKNSDVNMAHSGVVDPEHDLYNVVEVVDGDTIKVVLNDTKETIRMIGMNTPESVDPRRPVECFGIEASNKAKEILNGRRVTLQLDLTQGDRDKYGRLLRFVFLEDGTNFGEYMIREGYAYEYTYKKPHIYHDLYKDAQKFAQENKKGLWADGVCEK